jgi:hypothetical protein
MGDTGGSVRKPTAVPIPLISESPVHMQILLGWMRLISPSKTSVIVTILAVYIDGEGLSDTGIPMKTVEINFQWRHVTPLWCESCNLSQRLK